MRQMQTKWRRQRRRHRKQHPSITIKICIIMFHSEFDSFCCELQRISDGQLEGRVARQSIESMTDLRQLVISHCHQHPRTHPDITSQAHPPPQQQQQPLFANGVVSSNLTTSTELPSPQPFLLRVPSLQHQVKSFVTLRRII